jgi:hypothetical protein
MAWSGGAFTRANGATEWVTDYNNGVGIEPARHDAQDNDLATGINQCLNKDGSNAATGALNLGLNKITNLASGTVSTDAITLGQAQAGIDTQGTALIISQTRFSADTSGPVVQLQKSRGATVGTNTIVQNGDILGVVRFNGANGTGYTEGAYVAAFVDGAPGATNDMPGRLTFATTADGAGIATERMRIDSAGNIAIGTSTTTGWRTTIRGASATSADYAIVVQNGTPTTLAFCRNDGLFSTGEATASPTNNTTASGANVNVDAVGILRRSTSSIKYKTDVNDLTHGLAEVLQLRPVTYKGNNDGDIMFGGLIAEEVHDVGLTEFVQYAKDGTPDALAYSNMVALAFKAIQELNTKVEALQSRIAALES